MAEQNEYMVYTNEQIVDGLKVIRESSLDSAKDWHLTCIDLIDRGFNTTDLKLQITEFEKVAPAEEQDLNISEASKQGSVGHALNFLWNYLESYASAQYVRLQFIDLLDNFIANVSVE